MELRRHAGQRLHQHRVALPGQSAGNGAGKGGDAYRASFIKGIHYLLAAQFPNGGFPQVWPLEGGYHDAITFNDNAVSESAETLSDVAEAKPGYDFVPADLRKQAAAAVDKALQCILESQIVINGKKTVWAQQEDALTLAPVSARNYEPGALAASESADFAGIPDVAAEPFEGTGRVDPGRSDLAEGRGDLWI